MRRQVRPFIIEVKHKRASAKRGQSIWGDLDLAAVAAETTGSLGTGDLPDRRLIASDPSPAASGNGRGQPAEHRGTGPQRAEAAGAAAETPAAGSTPEPKKRATRQKQAKARPKRPAESDAAESAAKAAEASAARAGTGRKVHSKQQRAEKLGRVAASIGRGESLKNAAAQAGISVQTYYQWKRAAEPATPDEDEQDLSALEKENEWLKKQLVEHLRKENGKLKKKLGLK